MVTFTIYLPNADHQDLFWASISILALNFLLRLGFACFSLATTWFSNHYGCGGKVCCCKCPDGTRASCNDLGDGGGGTLGRGLRRATALPGACSPQPCPTCQDGILNGGPRERVWTAGPYLFIWLIPLGKY